MGLKIFSANVRGWNNFDKRRQQFLYLKNKKGHFYFIQETHCVNRKQKIWVNEWGEEAFFQMDNLIQEVLQF